MSSSADLVIRILADTSSAEAGVSRLSGALGKALGLGALAGIAAEGLAASMSMETAMSRVQMAYNNVDFAPGTARYIEANNKILQLSTTMATSYEDVAASMAQAAKVTDEYGNKLPTAKLNEFVDANLRLKAASQDSMDALTSGQNMAMFDKMFSSQDYKGTASAIAALTTQHPQDEGTLWSAAIGIAQLGAPMGVTMAQALGIGNYLSDTGGGGMRGGASIGRMLLRMDTSADAVLDPESRYSDEQKKRSGQERLDDLQTSLKEAEARHKEMYGQNGLKTQYRRHPSEVLAADDHIAKLKRDIEDQKANIAHENDPNRSRPRGTMNVTEMAKTAGQDPTAYAELFKENPIEALLAFTRGLHELPASKRGAAETKAGITQTKDQTTIDLLSDQPDSVDRMIGIAAGQFKTRTALDQISNVGLNTTASKVSDVLIGIHDAMGMAADPARKALDKNGLTPLVKDINADGGLPRLQEKVEGATEAFNLLNVGLGVLAPVLPYLATALPGMLALILPRAGAIVSGAGAAAGGAATLAGGAAAEAVALAPVFATAVAIALGTVAAKDLFDNVDALLKGPDAVAAHQRDLAGHGINVNVGDIHAGETLEAVIAAVTTKITAAWNTAMSTQPVQGQLGGAYTTGATP